MARCARQLEGIILLCLLLTGGAAIGQDGRRATVGLSVEIKQLVIPGGELEAKPIKDDRQPVVVRVANAAPHGTDYRYDLVYYGLEPGEYNLMDFLQRKDGGELGDVVALTVTVIASLPPGQVEPHSMQSKRTPRPSNYRVWMAVAIGVWIVGLYVILRVGRRKPGDAGDASEAQQVTFADRLRPLVEKTRNGEINQHEAAELERLLITYWRHRLDLEHLPARDLLQEIRNHPDAGRLLLQIERWLHHPDPAKEVDLEPLLETYSETASADR